MHENELMHYGVLGMKWGVRKNPAQAYSKAIVKKQKLEKRVETTRMKYNKAVINTNSGVSAKYKKHQATADRLQYKADKKNHGFFADDEKAAELQAKADRAQYKANKYKHKAEKREADAGKKHAEYLKAQHKAEKWVKSMDKVFTQERMSQINKQDVDVGMKYVEKFVEN